MNTGCRRLDSQLHLTRVASAPDRATATFRAVAQRFGPGPSPSATWTAVTAGHCSAIGNRL
jgi:hypothetical protein